MAVVNFACRLRVVAPPSRSPGRSKQSAPGLAPSRGLPPLRRSSTTSPPESRKGIGFSLQSRKPPSSLNSITLAAASANYYRRTTDGRVRAGRVSRAGGAAHPTAPCVLAARVALGRHERLPRRRLGDDRRWLSVVRLPAVRLGDRRRGSRGG